MKFGNLNALVLAICLILSSAAKAQSQPGNDAQNNGTEYPQATPPPAGVLVPPELTLPAGTLITARTTEPLSSDRNRTGDAFSSILEQPLVAQGWVVARIGQLVEGRVAEAQPAGRAKKKDSRLGVELNELVLVDGKQVPIRTQLIESSTGSSHGRDAATVGATTGTGAVIGAIAGRGEGAAIGAAIGAAAGVIGVLSTPGRATELAPETVLTFRLEQPVTIYTQQSQQAFQPVTQQDYSNRGPQRNPPRYRNADVYPPPGTYYYPPYYWDGIYPYWGGYGPFGYYGYYSFGPRVYLYPRIYGGRGFRGRR